MEYLCFVNSNSHANNVHPKMDLKIVEFQPNLFRLYSKYESENDKEFRKTLFRVYISILTRFRTKIYFAISDTNEVVHFSVVIPRNFKYPFLKKNEFCIGPCNTVENARGLGIYPYVLQKILSDNQGAVYYMLIKKDNNASIRGVKKAGFMLCDKRILGTKFLNRFKSM